MRFLLDTNILIPLEDSKRPLEPSLANFVRLATSYGHQLVYHPASKDDINQDKDLERRKQTLDRLQQYTPLEKLPPCPWNVGSTNRNDIADNEILYALEINAIHGLVTEDQGIHSKAKSKGLAQHVYTIQTAEDLLRRLHERESVHLPNINDTPLYSLTPLLDSPFFDSLRGGYPEFDTWFRSKAQEGREAWVNWEREGVIGGICIYTLQTDEKITEDRILPGQALKISTFKVDDNNRGKKIGELFLKAAFRYASQNHIGNIFIHGDMSRHHFLFEMLEDFGFYKVGYHPGTDERDAVYLKEHPIEPPVTADLTDFEYSRRYFPHFRSDEHILKFVVPIQPDFHRILFPDYESPVDRQPSLFASQNSAGNAIKLAYLCHAQTKDMPPGSVVLFYRSGDERAITSLGIVESYETSTDADEIAAKVKRRTVYTMQEIKRIAEKPTRVMLFRLIKHFKDPRQQQWLIDSKILRGPPQSITLIDHEKFTRINAHE